MSTIRRMQSFEPELTSNWLVSIEGIRSGITGIDSRYLFASEVTAPLSDVDVLHDDFDLPRSSKSAKQLMLSLYVDAEHKTEIDLIGWYEQQYKNSDGTTPTYSPTSTTTSANRLVTVRRLNTSVNITDPVGLNAIIEATTPIRDQAATLNVATSTTVLQYQCIPLNLPEYVGSPTAQMRMIQIQLKVLSTPKRRGLDSVLIAKNPILGF